MFPPQQGRWAAPGRPGAAAPPGSPLPLARDFQAAARAPRAPSRGTASARARWLLLCAALASGSARAEEGAAPGVVVWLEASPPAVKIQADVDRLTDHATPFAWGDYAFTRTPATDADQGLLTAVGAAVDSARKRWNDFDVEQGIAAQIGIAVDAVSLVRSADDRDALVRALLLDGLAASRAFPEQRFATMEEAAPFRAQLSGQAVPRAWLDALALDPDHGWTRADLDDGAGLAALLALQAEVRGQPRAHLTIPGHPPGVTLVVDGMPIADDAALIELVPGHHYVHAIAGTRIAGRAELDLDPGQSSSFPMLVTDQVLTDGKAAVLADRRDLPAPLTAALESYRTVEGHSARVYLAAMDTDGRPHLVPYAGGATLTRPKPLSALVAADLGGGMVVSNAFDQHPGQSATALVAGPHLGLQIGVYNAFVLGGASLYVAPKERFVWKADQNPNVAPAAVLPYGGIGAYLPRPTSGTPLAQVAATYGALLPGSRGFGLMVGCGIPVQRDGTWVRISMDGYRGREGSSSSAPDTTTWAALLRVGFERLL